MHICNLVSTAITRGNVVEVFSSCQKCGETYVKKYTAARFADGISILPVLEKQEIELLRRDLSEALAGEEAVQNPNLTKEEILEAVKNNVVGF